MHKPRIALAIGMLGFGGAFADAPVEVRKLDEVRQGQENLEFETSGWMARKGRPAMKHLPADWRVRSGADGLNWIHEKDPQQPWFIEYQKTGRDWVAAGLADRDRDKVRWGLKILTWGFGRMEPDGGFGHPDAYHSASFFVEAVVHTIVLLESSPWRGDFAGEIEALKPPLLKAARWMIRPDVDALNWPADGPGPRDFPQIFGERRYAHRRYLDAAALGGAGALFGDGALIRKGEWLIRNGVAMQTPEGVNPERSGPDTSYQALGLVYACRYFQLFASDSMRDEMEPALRKGFDWLSGRIREDGSIDPTGNTRTGPSGEPSRDGKPKGLDHLSTGAALAHWAILGGGPAMEERARRVFEWRQAAR